jgi:hypothetical protein
VLHRRSRAEGLVPENFSGRCRPAAREGALRQESLTGLERLTAVTALLHRIRLKTPRGGVWEAADMQWWWRRPRVSDEVALPVWFDDADQPIAAAPAA